MNEFPRDFKGELTGFGGDASKTRDQHRAAIKKTPVVLVHGNASHSADPTFGMLTMREFLRDFGYQPSEIWAMDYLGESNKRVFLDDTVHRDHIDALRGFIDKVIDYLGVKKIDIIAHSLGCTMTKGYLRGLKSSKPQVNFDHENDRLDSVSTLVCLAGALHGITDQSQAEFRPNGEFMKEWPEFNGDKDESAFGEDEKQKQIVPNSEWKEVTRLDNDQIDYVALIANNDFIDHQNRGTGHIKGANFIKIYELGPSTIGHEKIIKNQAVFDDFKGFLNRSAPNRTQIAINKASGNHGSKLAVTITVSPPEKSVNYTSKRLTKKFLDGFIVETVVATETGTLQNGGSLTLSSDGAWEVTFSADGAEDITRTYGVNVTIPEVTILTPDEKPFRRKLEVVSRATKGDIYFSLDGKRWNKGANVTITETSKVSFMAIDPEGLPSPIVSGNFQLEPTVSVTATLSEHFIARRITVNQFVELGAILGFTAVVTLYQVDAKWVLDPETAGAPAMVPAGLKVSALSIQERGVTIGADKPDGEYPESFDVLISVPRKKAAEKVTVYYTMDGSDPSNPNNPNRRSFNDSNRFKIEGNGAHSILCYAKNGAGKETSHGFAWTIDDQQYPETSLSPSMGGVYRGVVDVTLSPSERCEWTKYTIDNSDPSETNGEIYNAPISIETTATLKFRSKDASGNLEPVKSALFTILPQLPQAVFDNNAEKDGYVKANVDGRDAFVGSFSNLAVGIGRDGKENRAILHFDTSSLPDNVEIAKAYLEVKDYSKSGDFWADGRMIEVDVQSGCFGSSQAVQSEDWSAHATAEDVAHFDQPTAGMLRSTDFEEAGLNAINKTGVTQMRLRMNRPDATPGNCLFLKGGAEAKLLVEYSSAGS